MTNESRASSPITDQSDLGQEDSLSQSNKRQKIDNFSFRFTNRI